MKPIDRTGQHFGNIKLVKKLMGGKYVSICKCGTIRDVYMSDVLSGKTKSCGCLHKEIASTHRQSKSKEYKTYHGMINRCYNPNIKAYKYYGLRGISVCERWLNSFENFYQDMGARPSNKHSLDRIDNDGNYTLENCRWATRKIQDRNTRGCHFLNTPWGRMTMIEASEKSGINKGTLRERIKRGWSEDILFVPIKTLYAKRK